MLPWREYNEAFPLWVAEVYRNHGYEPDTWYGSEVAEKMHKEALTTYKGPPATMLDYAANAMKGSKVCTQITFEESECERS